MIIHKLGHACLLIESDDGRILIDPGTYSDGFEDLSGLDAILITHSHADHLDMDRLPALLDANPETPILADAESASTLEDAGYGSRVTVVEAGQEHRHGLRVEVIGSEHAVIHPEIPIIPNHGYLIEGRFFHPGDALTVPDREIEILGLPIGAPWLKASECIDYLRAVAPSIAIPIHDAVLTRPQMIHRLVDQLGPEALDFRIIEDGSSETFS